MHTCLWMRMKQTLMRLRDYHFCSVILMTIDDELILELIKPDESGNIGKEALILKVLKKHEGLIIGYKLEESTCYKRSYTEGNERTLSTIKTEIIDITPDITIAIHVGKGVRLIAVELENDIQWDFGRSLRQTKRYRENLNFFNTTVIIPQEYRRFAPLYKNERISVYLWKATRKWQCLRCGEIATKEEPITPKCKNAECNNHSRDEFRLVGLENVDIEEYVT